MDTFDFDGYRPQCEKLVTFAANNAPQGFVPDYHFFTNRKRFRQYFSSSAQPAVCYVIGANLPLLVLFKLKCMGSLMVDARYCVENLFGDSDLCAEEISVLSAPRTVGTTMLLSAAAMGARWIDIVGMDGYSDEILSKGTHHAGYSKKISGAARRDKNELNRLRQIQDSDQQFLDLFSRLPVSEGKLKINFLTSTSFHLSH